MVGSGTDYLSINCICFVLGYAGSLKATGNKLSSDKYEKFLKILEKTTAHNMTNARQV